MPHHHSTAPGACLSTPSRDELPVSFHPRVRGVTHTLCHCLAMRAGKRNCITCQHTESNRGPLGFQASALTETELCWRAPKVLGQRYLFPLTGLVVPYSVASVHVFGESRRSRWSRPSLAHAHRQGAHAVSHHSSVSSGDGGRTRTASHASHHSGSVQRSAS